MGQSKNCGFEGVLFNGYSGYDLKCCLFDVMVNLAKPKCQRPQGISLTINITTQDKRIPLKEF